MIETIEALTKLEWLLLGSITLSIPSITSAVSVCWAWYQPAVRAALQGLKTEYQMLIAGIFIKFAGTFLDGIYWTPTWSAAFVDMESGITQFLFNNGGYFNIPFRYLPDTAAALLHIAAAVKTDDKSLKYLLWSTIGIIFAWDWMIIFFKSLVT